MTVEQLDELFTDLEIIGLIGQGGMGAVYQARQKQLDRIVALKVIMPGLTNDPTFSERFAREARALAKLTHAHIVTVYDFGTVDQMGYLIMEYVDGINLRDAIREKTIGPDEALKIVPQICEALQFAHDEGVVHRDIKPENILLNSRGQIKIADFGLAKMLDRETGNYTLTATHQIVGTRNYMAPEQIEKPESVDHRADIYSLGVVFYELLTGELPIGRFAVPSEKASINEHLDDVVLRTLEKEPGKRFQQASEFKTAVETIGPPPKIRPPISQPMVAAQGAARGAAQIAAANQSPNQKDSVSVPFTIEELQAGFAAAYGIATFDGEQLFLEFDVRDEVFGAIKTQPKKLAMLAADILSMHYKQGVFSSKIEFSMSSISVAAPVPNSKQGKFKIKIKKQDRAAADAFANSIDLFLKKNPNRVPPKAAAVVAQNAAQVGLATGQPATDDSEKTVEQKTAWPINGLMVIAIVNIVFAAIAGIRFSGDFVRAPGKAFRNWLSELNFPALDQDFLSNLFEWFFESLLNPLIDKEWLVALVAGIIILVAAKNFRRFTNQKLVWFGIILAMIPVYQIYFVGLGFAIWAAVVMNDDFVKARFEHILHAKPKAPSQQPANAFAGCLQALLILLMVAGALTLSAAIIYFAAVSKTQNRIESKSTPEVTANQSAESVSETIEETEGAEDATEGSDEEASAADAIDANEAADASESPQAGDPNSLSSAESAAEDIWIPTPDSDSAPELQLAVRSWIVIFLFGSLVVFLAILALLAVVAVLGRKSQSRPVK